MHARVVVTLKREVLDPQGEAVRRALVSLGIEQVGSVRIGKIIDIEIEGEPADARAKIENAARQLLSNPVIEDWRIDAIE